MTESYIVLVYAGTLVGWVAGIILWMVGGRSQKLWRRLGSSIVWTLTVNLSALAMSVWTWKLLLLLPALVIGSSLGYGGDTVPEKVWRRSVFWLGVVVLSGGVCLWTYWPKAIFPFILHLGVGAWTISFAAKNPFHAPVEEAIVASLLTGILMAYPYLA